MAEIGREIGVYRAQRGRAVRRAVRVQVAQRVWCHASVPEDVVRDAGRTADADWSATRARGDLQRVVDLLEIQIAVVRSEELHVVILSVRVVAPSGPDLASQAAYRAVVRMLVVGEALAAFDVATADFHARGSRSRIQRIGCDLLRSAQNVPLLGAQQRIAAIDGIVAIGRQHVAPPEQCGRSDLLVRLVVRVAEFHVRLHVVVEVVVTDHPGCRPLVLPGHVNEFLRVVGCRRRRIGRAKGHERCSTDAEYGRGVGAARTRLRLKAIRVARAAHEDIAVRHAVRIRVREHLARTEVPVAGLHAGLVRVSQERGEVALAVVGVGAADEAVVGVASIRYRTAGRREARVPRCLLSERVVVVVDVESGLCIELDALEVRLRDEVHYARHRVGAVHG